MENGYQTYHVLNPYDDGIGLDQFVDRFNDAGYPIQRIADYNDWLQMTRAGVAWMAVGCALGAYENALAYARTRQQFGRPIGDFQLVQDLSGCSAT